MQTLTPAYLENTKVIVEPTEDDNLARVTVVQHKRDQALLALNDSGQVIGTLSLKKNARVDIADCVYMGHEYIEEMLLEGRERAIRGLWVYRVRNGQVEHFDRPSDDVKDDDLYDDIPIEVIE